MAMITQMDTRGMEPIDPPAMRPLMAPSLETPQRPPGFISNFPIAGPNNSFAVANFKTNLPTNFIIPAQPLNMSGAAINAVATVSQVPKLIPPVPAPAISSPLVSVAAGYQFSYLEVRLPLGANLTISSYKIYRNTANNSASASVIQTNPHNINGISTPVIVTDNVANGATRFYWVSAVSTSGRESNLTPAQSGTVANTALANANSQLASSFNGNPINATWLPVDATTLSNDGIHTIINIVSNTSQFGPGQISYNSGTIDPGSTGTYYVYAKDPQFTGGSIIYHVSGGTVAPLTAIAAGDGVLLFGAIASTATSGAVTGGGNTGGSSAAPVSGGGGGLGAGAAGGRGIGALILSV